MHQLHVRQPLLEEKQNMLMLVGAMGGRNKPDAVVDPTGKVYGVQRLRIVDASIFPLLPPGHPQATVCKTTEHMPSRIPGLLRGFFRYACRKDRRRHTSRQMRRTRARLGKLISCVSRYLGYRKRSRVYIDLKSVWYQL